MIDLDPLPTPLAWRGEPAPHALESGRLAFSAPARSDLFTDPVEGGRTDSAPMLLFDARGDARFEARVEVEFGATFDAGVLVAYQHEASWAKFCFERSPQGEPTIVSVVTKGTSDDGNSVAIDGNAVRLRIARLGDAFAFHWAEVGSGGGAFWHLTRLFRLEPEAPTRLGFLVQSPTGDGCRATFSEIGYAPGRLGDVRSGE